MEGDRLTYDDLVEAASPGCDAFDIHVVASILAIGIEEARLAGLPIVERIGLQPAALRRLAVAMFPATAGILSGLTGEAPLAVESEEQSVVDILWMYASPGGALQRDLAGMIARRCLQPHHLWQDLGLRDRGELSRLMRTHFAGLAKRNRNDMKWKKFLYRTVCGSEGFTICASPVCSDCDDYNGCFGAEDGKPLLLSASPSGAPAASQPTSGQ